MESDYKICLTNHLCAQLKSIFMSNEFADVVFIVEGERIPAHRLVLATRSEYFRSMFAGMSGNEICEMPMLEPLLPFKALVQYMYSGILHVPYNKHMIDALLGVLKFASKYLLGPLIPAIADALLSHVSVDNVIEFLIAGRSYNVPELIRGYFNFVERNAQQFLEHDSTKRLPKEVLLETIKRDTFCAPEIDILRMTLHWNSHNNSSNNLCESITPILSKIRFCLINGKELQSVTSDPDMLLKLTTTANEMKESLPRRYILWENEVIPLLTKPFRGFLPFVKLVEFAMINYIEITIDINDAPITVTIEDDFKTLIVLNGVCNPTAKIDFAAKRVRTIHVQEDHSLEFTLLSVRAMYKR